MTDYCVGYVQIVVTFFCVCVFYQNICDVNNFVMLLINDFRIQIIL